MKRVLSNSANFDLLLPFCSFQTYIDKYTNTNTIFSYIDLFASLHMAHRTRQKRTTMIFAVPRFAFAGKAKEVDYK